MKQLIGKTIKSIEEPEEMNIDDGSGVQKMYDDNIQITFTDGTILKLASWDYESYRSGIYSGIYKQIIIK